MLSNTSQQAGNQGEGQSIGTHVASLQLSWRATLLQLLLVRHALLPLLLRSPGCNQLCAADPRTVAQCGISAHLQQVLRHRSVAAQHSMMQRGPAICIALSVQVCSLAQQQLNEAAVACCTS